MRVCLCLCACCHSQSPFQVYFCFQDVLPLNAPLTARDMRSELGASDSAKPIAVKFVKSRHVLCDCTLYRISCRRRLIACQD